MKNNYGKDNQKSYQASPNKPDTRNPNAPTQGGFSTPGGGQGKNLNDKTKHPQSKDQTQKTNNWGTGSIDKNKDRR